MTPSYKQGLETEHETMTGDRFKGFAALIASAHAWAPRHWGVAVKLWLAFGLLLLILAVSGFVAQWYIQRIDNDLIQIVAVEEPLEHAVLEMEINAGETALAVLDYVRDQDPKRLETIQDAEVDYGQFAAEYKRLSETDEERQLGREVERFYREPNTTRDVVLHPHQLQHRHQYLLLLGQLPQLFLQPREQRRLNIAPVLR